VISAALAALALVLAVPALRGLFRLAAPSVADVALSVAAAIASVLWFEIYKYLRNQRRARASMKL
jgi:hypothetical protein